MKLEQAPEQGIMYALYKDRMIFEPYKKEELPKEDELKRNLLSCIYLMVKGISVYKNEKVK